MIMVILYNPRDPSGRSGYYIGSESQSFLWLLEYQERMKLVFVLRERKIIRNRNVRRIRFKFSRDHRFLQRF